MTQTWLLLDRSASMTGAPLEALKQAVGLFAGQVAAQSGARLAIIGYDSRAEVLLPPTAARRDEDALFGGRLAGLLAALETGGTSNLGGALRLLVSEVVGGMEAVVVVIFSDGGLTDEWNEGWRAARAVTARVIAVACGMAADRERLMRVSDRVLTVGELTPEVVRSALRG
jgi:uncharacterized protein YegL